jgi:hypothetical protein
MSILDTIAPRRGPRQRRLTKTLVAKTAFYVSVALTGLFILGSVILFENDRTLEVVPATRDSFAVIDEVQEYLKITTHRGFLNQDNPVSCWDSFENAEFSAEYLLYGSWQINAFYSRVRYYWRVDDNTMAVTRDRWLSTYTPTIKC